MASIFSLDKQVAHLSKHGFPMSQDFNFTSSCGHLLPIYFDKLNPGEKWRYGVDLFTRTQPLSSPANVDIDEYVDVFFVPLKKISSAADNILFQIQDLGSSSLPTVNTDQVLPMLDLAQLPVDIQNGGSNAYLGTYTDGLTYVGQYAPFFESYVSGMLRLFDHLGIDPHVLFQGEPVYTPYITPDAFAVYQAIYFDYYRLSNWQSNFVYAYNLDQGYQTMDLLSAGNIWATPFALRELLSLRYRAWSKDYFTNVFPSPLISGQGMLQNGILNLNEVNQWLINRSYSPIRNGSVDITGQGTTEGTVLTSSYAQATMQTALSTASLRTLFAVDKLMKITARAGKHYDDQVLAHFGFKVPKGYSNEVVHLGTHHQQIHIGEVISTATTNDSVLGELAGKGYAKGVGQVVKSFTAPCHGYVMAIYSCAPRINYVGGLDRLHTMAKRYDWFIPEIDNLGMQPMFSFERNQKAATPTVRAAWQLRYMHLKCKYNRATYAFQSTADISGLVQNTSPFGDWCLTDPFPFAGPSFQTIELGRLLVNPCMLNQIMLAQYAPTLAGSDLYDYDGNAQPQNLYSLDPLIHFVRQKVSKISGMSIYGLDDKAI